jgi:serine/threonine-protein kinase
MLTAGTRLGPYEIVAPLGAGGMGEVFRARDGRLGREVALKVLPPGVASDPDRLRRFEIEARAASALNHPNILVVFDVGEHAGRPFLVTELLEGRTLREALADGPVPVGRAIDWVTQLATGLAAAHDKGILHRDLKPENVFVCADGRIKILDFGLAKLSASASTAESLAIASTVAGGTELGTLLGTMGYMAPEQLRGEPLDARADLFALGCILHELLAGRPLFRRETQAETLAATMTEPPPRLPAVDSGLHRVLERCLAKRREDRYTSVAPLLSELRALGGGRAKPLARRSKTIGSVAVLPFANESGDPDLEYMSDGIAESLLDALTRLPKVKVLARSTMVRFKGRVDEPLDVGRELGVDAVVAGRLSQRGDELRVACELARVADGARLWGRQFESKSEDLPVIRDEIGSALVEHLRGRSAKQRRSDDKPLPSAPVYQAFLRGRHAWNRWTADSMRAAIRHYDAAIALDPAYAPAWAGLADAWTGLAQTKAIAPGEGFPRGRAAAERALALDSGLAEAHAALGLIRRLWEWDWPGSESALRRAIALAPSCATAYHWLAFLYSGLGRHDEALAAIERALELDPLSLVILTSVGNVHFFARRYEKAIRCYRHALDVDAEFFVALTDLARSLEHSGRIEEAVAAYEHAIRIAGDSVTDPSAGLANVLAVAGRRDQAQAMLGELERQRAERYVSPWALASIHARLEENAAALDWLERALEERDSTLTWLKVHPRFDSLHEEPRFRALLARMKL